MRVKTTGGSKNSCGSKNCTAKTSSPTNEQTVRKPPWSAPTFKVVGFLIEVVGKHEMSEGTISESVVLGEEAVDSSVQTP